MYRRIGFIAAILLIAIIPHCYRYLCAPPSFYHDDVFYYFQTARNIAAGYGSTFDRINETNGFHPLWMAVCVVTAFLPLGDQGYFAAILLMSLLFVVLLSLQIFRMFEDELGTVFTALTVFLINWNLYTGLNVFSGLETPLYLWLVFVTIDRLVKCTWSTPREALGVGILLGFTFLARTSFVLFFPVLFAALFLDGRFRRAEKKWVLLLPLLAPVAIMGGPFLLWNYSLTGHIQQISGLVKDLLGYDATWAQIARRGLPEIVKPILLRPFWLNVAMIAWPCLIIWMLLRAGSPGREVDRRSPLHRAFLRLGPLFRLFGNRRLAILVAYALLTGGYHIIRYGGLAAAWHYMELWLAVQLVFMHVVKTAYAASAPILLIRSVLTVMLAGMWLNYLVQVPLYIRAGLKVHPWFLSETDYGAALTQWVREHTPPDATIGVFNAGLVGFFSGRRIVNLDGLINGKELYEYMKDGRGPWRYAVDKKLDYVADYYFGPPPELPPEIAGKFRLVRRVGRTDIAIRGVPTYIDGYVWKIDHDSGP